MLLPVLLGASYGSALKQAPLAQECSDVEGLGITFSMELGE